MKRAAAALVAILAASLARADGAATFKAKCAMCHGQDANGGAMFKQSIRGLPEAEVLKMVQNGKGKMKAVQLEAADAQAVAKYVSGLKK
ncbi:MAG TPA: cytochrome c [Anaeromyxobacteraceae bacterium]|nr:cytochrome c [Anaeromyxobacteraceae bacterium]